MAIIEKVVIPALLSLLTGIFIGSAVLAIALLRGWGQPWAVFLAVMAIIAAITWLALLRRSGSDGRRVNLVDAPFEDPPPVRVDVITQEPGGYIGGQFLDLPAEPGQLITLADGLVNGLSLSEGSWTGAGAPFSRSQFRTLRDALIYSGLARWKDERYRAQGVILSPAGRAVMRRFASMTAKPLPQLKDKTSTIVDK